eukprot:CAMPEP_0178907340 /NCGR_PEP_ID=MMETSP0786-20121207/7318_1 /TAXON_ID=186022 /ORGANISM="Thalassionema frauenfeldii, Strain CCMP 1798" /LENGTH=336 /DNA_ID=CAMNT_0020579131 /DNA_START=258 /DNA_END=1268 /DNA_ORIENTATION=-
MADMSGKSAADGKAAAKTRSTDDTNRHTSPLDQKKQEIVNLTQEQKQELQKALSDIPAEEKAAYTEALSTVPHLVQTESGDERFLRFADFHAEKAAASLVKYWRLRKELFGSDKAFLPMTITGALRDDTETLDIGLAMLLPNDCHGRTVFYFNQSGFSSPPIDKESMHRVFFYFLHVNGESSAAQDQGIVFLENYEGYDLYTNWDRPFIKRCQEMRGIFTNKIRAIHFFTGRGSNTVLNEFIFPMIKFILGLRLRLRFQSHSGDSQFMRKNMLSKFGIEPRGLPESMGGSFSKNDFRNWLANRKQLEEQRTTKTYSNSPSDSNGSSNNTSQEGGVS